MKKIINTPTGIIEADLTSEEIVERNQNVNKFEQHKLAEADMENKKASAKQKLLDLGLTDAEVKAIRGV